MVSYTGAIILFYRICVPHMEIILPIHFNYPRRYLDNEQSGGGLLSIFSVPLFSQYVPEWSQH